MTKWFGVFRFALALLAIALSACWGSGQVAPTGNRPNFLIIITDDQRYGTLGSFMPLTQVRIFDQGVTFTNGYVTTPLCCPSRSSIFTGMYAHNHGVLSNQDDLSELTFMRRLHDNNYFTGHIGKYLNSWPGSARPEFDYWVGLPSSGSPFFDNDPYINPPMNVQGTWVWHQGYVTHILRDYALQFLEIAAQQNEPFVLIFAPNAPHAPAVPAPGDENLYPDLPLHRPPSYNEADVSDKPLWLQERRPLSPDLQQELDGFRRLQLQTLWSVDQAINAILDRLEQQGQLDNTVIFYISDNGYLWGEHRLRAKNRVYEEATHVPFAVRYPRLVPTGRIERRLVANIDIAPTIYELAGLPIPPEVDGRSLVPLLEGQGGWRSALLLEGWPNNGELAFAAAHTKRYVYVETQGDRSELYDLVIDPYQLENRVDDPAYEQIVAQMRRRLQRLLRQ